MNKSTFLNRNKLSAYNVPEHLRNHRNIYVAWYYLNQNQVLNLCKLNIFMVTSYILNTLPKTNQFYFTDVTTIFSV